MRLSLSRAVQETKLPLTPLIDVTFLVLCFFMLALRFPTLQGKLAAYLPVTYDGGGPIEKVEVLMKVIEPGRRLDPIAQEKPWSEIPGTRFVYDDSRVIEYLIGPRKTRDLSALQDRLEALYDARPGSPVTIDARKEIVYGDVVKVIDAAMNAGYEDVHFVGSYE